MEGAHSGWEGVDDPHGDLPVPDTITSILNSFVDEMGELCESCDEVPNAVIIIDFGIVVVLPRIVFGRGTRVFVRLF